MTGPIIDTDMSGVASLLQDGSFSDVTIELADGNRILAHRNILAAASEVLRAKFLSPTLDAAESVWRPEHGTAPAWQWVTGWMYGKREALPWDLLVEVLVLADYLQLSALIAGIASLDLSGNVDIVACQLLDAQDCPLPMRHIAAKVVPCVTVSTDLWAKFLQASLPVVQLFLKHLELQPLLPMRASADDPVCFIEECVLVLLGARLRSDGMEFSDCLVDSIRWDAFPARILEQARFGDVAHFRTILNTSWYTISADVKEHLAVAMASRCERLENMLQKDPSQETTQQGLFSRMREKGLGIEVRLSSNLPQDSADSASALTSLTFQPFGTGNQSATDQPWIELSSRGTMVYPRAVGLCHGLSSNDVCKTFVVEAAAGDGQWRQLLVIENVALSATCELHSLPLLSGTPETGHHKAFFNRFRLRMTGPNSSGRWYLMVSWFDVFGIPASSEVVSVLASAVAFRRD